MDPTTQPEAHPQTPGQWGRLAWLPIPLLLAAIIAARLAGLSDTYESHTLLLVLSFTFYTLVSLGTLYLTTINWSCRQFESIYPAIRITREIDVEEDEVPKSLKIVIYRVLQEALNNIAKHSKTSIVLLSLRKTDQAIQLVIRDGGHGFNPEEAYSRKGAAKGLGLDSMRERTELSGGFFAIESAEGKGTTVRASWPLSEKG